MTNRIVGFDLARAYAIFGMFIVNFNFSFGAVMNPRDEMDGFLNLFTGNSTAIFIICAGMGVALMSKNENLTDLEKKQIRSKVLKRSWFLFALGLLLFNWWSGDILHFYGGYMHVCAFLLFIPKRYYLVSALVAIAVFHILFLIFPIETGWDFSIFRYTDFWSPTGFLRNTLFNGWNSLFPWISYFLLGMYLGKLNWNKLRIRRNIFLVGAILFGIIHILRYLDNYAVYNEFWHSYIAADYFPPFLPFLLLTMGFALMVITACLWIGERFPRNFIIRSLQQTGQMTLSHYVVHVTLGMILLSVLTNKTYTGFLEDEKPTSSGYILLYSCAFFVFSVAWTIIWRKKFKLGPLEWLMRKISG